MRIAVFTVAAAALAVLCSAAEMSGQPERWRVSLGTTHPLPASLKPIALQTAGTRLIEQRRASWPALRPSSPQEEILSDRIAALEIMKRLHEKDLISRWEVANSERAVAELRSTISGDRETSEAIQPSPSDEKNPASKSNPASKGKAPRRRPMLIRYEGSASWTIDDADKIDAFFRQRFGRALPISAFGQTPTHDRFGLDHSDAIDVAVRPDSAEGRDLMAYLRSAGIPFIAFRGRISRVSTGPHIHIGPPSPRLNVAHEVATEDVAEQS